MTEQKQTFLSGLKIIAYSLVNPSARKNCLNVSSEALGSANPLVSKSSFHANKPCLLTSILEVMSSIVQLQIQ